MSRVWVPGGAGMLGAQLVATLRRRGSEVRATDMSDFDLTDAAAVQRFAETFRPTHVLNCAAYTAVDKAESEEGRATAVNGLAVAHLSQAARACGAVFLHISTDYVFAGEATAPYGELAPTAPLGAYGRSKLAGEQAMREVFGDLEAPGTGAVLMRTSWLFGPGGHNFARTMLRLQKDRDEVRVVADQRGRPTYAPDLVEAMLRLAGLSGAPAESGVFHFANAGECTWHAFAEAIWRAGKARFGLKCARVVPIDTAAYPTPAKRPAYSVLSTAKYEQRTGQRPRPWQDALTDYLNWYAEHPT